MLNYFALLCFSLWPRRVIASNQLSKSDYLTWKPPGNSVESRKGFSSLAPEIPEEYRAEKLGRDPTQGCCLLRFFANE